jgi:hypothetical protein
MAQQWFESNYEAFRLERILDGDPDEDDEDDDDKIDTPLVEANHKEIDRLNEKQKVCFLLIRLLIVVLLWLFTRMAVRPKLPLPARRPVSPKCSSLLVLPLLSNSTKRRSNWLRG